MYCQKRFNREDPDKDLEDKILDIHKNNKDYGYRRIRGELYREGIIVNKKKNQRIMQKHNLQVTSFTHKSRKYSSYKEKLERSHLIGFTDDSILIYHIRRLAFSIS